MLNLDFLQALSQANIETRHDAPTRTIYSTDASMYQIEPLAVAFPRVLDELNNIVDLAAKYKTPIIARGAGSGLTGGAIGAGLIVDTSRYLDNIIEVRHDREGGHSWASVEPGVVRVRSTKL